MPDQRPFSLARLALGTLAGLVIAALIYLVPFFIIRYDTVAKTIYDTFMWPAHQLGLSFGERPEIRLYFPQGTSTQLKSLPAGDYIVNYSGGSISPLIKVTDLERGRTVPIVFFFAKNQVYSKAISTDPERGILLLLRVPERTRLQIEIQDLNGDLYIRPRRLNAYDTAATVSMFIYLTIASGLALAWLRWRRPKSTPPLPTSTHERERAFRDWLDDKTREQNARRSKV
jgi:hypothetical protein